MTGIGVIGCGQRMRRLCRLLLELGGVHISAVYDPQKAQTERFIECCMQGSTTLPVRTHSSEELIRRGDVSWVMIGSPNRYHASQAAAALEGGKHVFLEKPLAVTSEQCVSLERMRAASGKILTTGFVLRYSPFYRRMRQILDEYDFGHVISLQASEHLSYAHGSYMMRNWRRNMTEAGAYVLEKCVHDFDLMQWMAASPVQRLAASGGRSLYCPDAENQFPPHVLQGWEEKGNLEADTPFTVSEEPSEDHAAVVMEFCSGAKGTFHTLAGSALPERRLAVHCLRGTLAGELYSAEITFKTVDMDTPWKESWKEDGLHGGGDSVLAEELHGQMLNGKLPSVDVKEGMLATLSGIAAGEALRSGEWVELTESLDVLGVFPITHNRRNRKTDCPQEGK